jgi:hypothetical protein
LAGDPEQVSVAVFPLVVLSVSFGFGMATFQGSMGEELISIYGAR